MEALGFNSIKIFFAKLPPGRINAPLYPKFLVICMIFATLHFPHCWHSYPYFQFLLGSFWSVDTEAKAQFFLCRMWQQNCQLMNDSLLQHRVGTILFLLLQPY